MLSAISVLPTPLDRFGTMRPLESQQLKVSIRRDGTQLIAIYECISNEKGFLVAPGLLECMPSPLGVFWSPV
jgi:hypothetical protein